MKFQKLFTTIDTHTGGNPTRTVISGLPKLKGETMSEKMLYMEENFDHYRKFLMNEPRGHGVMSGALIVDACHPEADVGVIYIETGGYLPMCGHDTIGCCTALIEAGLVDVIEPKTTLKLDTPAGLIHVDIKVENGKAKEVTFANAPSFLLKTVQVEMPELGVFNCDIAYGGNFYGIISAEDVNLNLVPRHSTEIINLGIEIRNKINREHEIIHPEYPFINGLTHIEFYTAPTHETADAKNTVVVPPGGIDRSPCGTGTSAKLATMFTKDEIGIDEPFVYESIVGSLFTGRVLSAGNIGNLVSIIPEVSGSAFIMGMHKFFYNERDPLKEGFLLIPPMKNE